MSIDDRRRDRAASGGSKDGKPGGQDKSREVRAGWGMAFLKPFKACARGARRARRLDDGLRARRGGISRTSRRS